MSRDYFKGKFEMLDELYERKLISQDTVNEYCKKIYQEMPSDIKFEFWARIAIKVLKHIKI